MISVLIVYSLFISSVFPEKRILCFRQPHLNTFIVSLTAMNGHMTLGSPSSGTLVWGFDKAFAFLTKEDNVAVVTVGSLFTPASCVQRRFSI